MENLVKSSLFIIQKKICQTQLNVIFNVYYIIIPSKRFRRIITVILLGIQCILFNRAKGIHTAIGFCIYFVLNIVTSYLLYYIECAFSVRHCESRLVEGLGEEYCIYFFADNNL